MNERSMKLIRTLLLILPFVLILFILYLNLFFGRVALEDAGTAYETRINGQSYYGAQKLKLRPGKYAVEFRGPRITAETNIVRVGFNSESAIKPASKVLTDEEIVKTLLETDRSYTIYSVKFFENDRWFVAYVGAPDEDSGPLVGHYGENGWQIEESGTGLSGEDLTELPVSVRQYLDEQGGGSDDSL